MTKVILVDKNDNQIGIKEKILAHKDADLHRAFSIFLFNDNQELLIHQRAHDKYHSGGLWTNTCCSHPFPNESTINAGKRRLFEELGIKAELINLCSLIYKFPLDNHLTEHELDHILIGKFNEQSFNLDTNEIANIRFISKEDLQTEIRANPKKFTEWFKLIIEKIDIFSKNY